MLWARSFPRRCNEACAHASRSGTWERDTIVLLVYWWYRSRSLPHVPCHSKVQELFTIAGTALCVGLPSFTFNQLQTRANTSDSPS